MTQYLINKRAFDRRRLVVVDVGARYGSQKHWDVYGDQALIIGFEPDEEECRNLNQKFSGKGHRYFPVALHKDRGFKTFYVTQFDATCGFYKRDMTFWSRLPGKEGVRVKETQRVETVDFDSFAKDHQIEYVDFMKLDAEGAELDILEGSVNFLRGGSVLGAAIEVTFLSIAKQPVFSDVDSFMRKMGFKLFDIEVYRRSREALPTPEELGYINSLLIGAPSKRGQVIEADALYLRDGAAEIEASDTESNWTDNSILKLASIFELYGLPDCAIELLQVAIRNNYLQGLDTEYLRDLLTPQFMGKDVTYCEYMEKLEYMKELKAKGDKGDKGFSVMEAVWKDSKLIGDMLWNDLKLIAAHYLPVPIKSFIKKTILRNLIR
ncbi:FkbM family methyltransferase [Chloroflexota bacterium]